LKFIITGGIIGATCGMIISYLLRGFSIWQAEIALRLRPELINLNWWEAFWSEHFSEWLWLINPNMAFILWAIFLAMLLGYFGALFGNIFED
jgi:hypothetical protein